MNARRHLVPGILILAASLLLPGCSKKGTGDGGDDGGPGSSAGETVKPPGDFQPSPTGNDTRPPVDEGDGDERTPDTPAWLEARLQPVFFAFDRYDLTQASRDTLTRNAGLLREYPTHSVVIEGHCDERGTNEYNLALGDRRARAARDFLIAAGIDAGRFSMVSYGEEQPFVVGHDEAAWSMNRRAHFRVRRGA